MKLLLIVTLLAISTAFAGKLDDFKDKGLIGELRNGYVAPISKQPTSETVKFIKRINNKRRAKYRQVAKKNKQQLEVIEKIVAQKLYKKLKKGHYYKSKQGKWAKR